MIAIFLDRMAAGQETLVYGDGLQTRDFVHVGDVARAMVAAVGAAPGVYNVGTGVDTTIVDLHAMCRRASETTGEPTFADPRPGEIRRSVLDPAAAERELGWQGRDAARARPAHDLGGDAARARRSDERAVESSASTTDALVRPWRTAAMVASLVAAVELLLILVLAIALFGGTLLDWAQGTAEATPAAKKREPAAVERRVQPPAAPAEPKLARTETSVLVLNGNGVAGAAASTGELVRQKGYVIAAVGNAARTDYRRSVVMYRPGYAGEAARFARDLRVKVVSPLDGLRLKDLMGAHVAVVIGAS